MNSKNDIKELFEKIRLVLILLGIVFGFVVFINMNSGEFADVNHRATKFAFLLINGDYNEAIKFVDNSKITIGKLKEAGSLAIKCSQGATYFYGDTNGVYIYGYKDCSPCIKLEYYFRKVGPEWKVTCISIRPIRNINDRKY